MTAKFTDAEKQDRYRQKKEREGLKAVTVYVRPDDVDKVKSFAKKLRMTEPCRSKH